MRVPGTLAASVRVGQLPLWGMVSMGVLSVGSATATVLPAWIPALSGPAVLTDGVLWIAGTLARVGHCYRLHGLLVRADAGRPSTVWGLAVVPPMVSATVGAGLVPHLTPTLQVAMLLVTFACFALSLTLGGVIFAVAYHHHWRVAGLADRGQHDRLDPAGRRRPVHRRRAGHGNPAGPLLPASTAAAVQSVCATTTAC